MSKFARVSDDDTLPPVIVRDHIIPMLDRHAVLCTKRYLSSLEHSEHWLQYRNVMVQLIVSELESPSDLFPDIKITASGEYRTCDGITWEDVPREALSGWDDRGICIDDVVNGKRYSVFKTILCTWFTGQPFHTIGNTKRIKQRLCNNQFVDPRSVFTRKYIGMCVQTTHL